MWKATAWWCWNSLTTKQETSTFYLLKFTCIAFRYRFFQRLSTCLNEVYFSVLYLFGYHHQKDFFSIISFNWLLFCIHEWYWFLHVLYLVTLLNFFIVWVVSLIFVEFSRYTIMSSANKTVLFFSLPIVMTVIDFFCLIALVTTSRTMLK